MQKRGRPSTKPAKLRDGFYIELRTQGSSGAIKIIRKNMEEVEKAIEIGNLINTGTFFMNRCDFLDPALPWVGIKDSGKGCTLSELGIQQLTRPKSYHLKLT